MPRPRSHPSWQVCVHCGVWSITVLCRNCADALPTDRPEAAPRAADGDRRHNGEPGRLMRDVRRSWLPED